TRAARSCAPSAPACRPWPTTWAESPSPCAHTAPGPSSRRATSSRSRTRCRRCSPTATRSSAHVRERVARATSSRGTRAHARTSPCTRSSYEAPQGPVRRGDPASAGRLRRGRGAWALRGGVRGLHGRRRGRDRGARRDALALCGDARRGCGRGIRVRVQPRRPQALARARPGDRQPVTSRIEDYALIGDLQAAALVDRRGSIDWLCFPRFDSGACFAALLGTPEHGRWLLAPSEGGTPTRRYLHDTLVLETTWESGD